MKQIPESRHESSQGLDILPGSSAAPMSRGNSYDETDGNHQRDQGRKSLIQKFIDLDVFGVDFLYTRFQLYDPEETLSSVEDESSNELARPPSEPPSGSDVLSDGRFVCQTDIRSLRSSVQEDMSKRANIRQTIMSILKSFVGAGVLFLPKAFLNGGLLLSSIILLLTFGVNVYSILRLLRCTSPTRETYGDIGEAACGRIGRAAVDISIFCSQLGFCAVYGVFISANVQDIIFSLSNCYWKLAFSVLIIAQIPIHTPLSWIRRLKYFAPAILLADVCIALGIATIFVYVVSVLQVQGPSPTVKAVNFLNCPLMFGTAIFLWEGIGLILPIRSAMVEKDQKTFPSILVPTLAGILCVYLVFASSAYVAFGKETSSVVLLNLPNSNFVYLIQAMYVVAVLMSFPLQLFPAAKIIEYALFGHSISGRVNLRRKWMKNSCRGLLVFITLIASYFGSTQLDNFVALIGAFCCLPLAIIYPCLFHLILYVKKDIVDTQTQTHTNFPSNEGTEECYYELKECEDHDNCAAWLWKLCVRQFEPWMAIDAGLMLLGFSAMILTIVQALTSWSSHPIVTRCEFQM